MAQKKFDFFFGVVSNVFAGFSRVSSLYEGLCKGHMVARRHRLGTIILGHGTVPDPKPFYFLGNGT